MTSSIKWEPIEDLKAVRNLLGRSLAGKISSRFVQGRPLTDLYETDVAFVAEIDVPGIEADDLDVSVYGSEIVLAIERPAQEERKYLYRERPVGKISRTIQAPDVVDTAQIQARVEKGVLVLTMPKREDAQEVKISVKAG